jgi:hypothetical protein
MPLPHRHHQDDRQLQEQGEEQEARGSIIGQDLQINAADLAAIQDTEAYKKMLGTMRNYRNRIQEICEWMQKEAMLGLCGTWRGCPNH